MTTFNIHSSGNNTDGDNSGNIIVNGTGNGLLTGAAGFVLGIVTDELLHRGLHMWQDRKGSDKVNPTAKTTEVKDVNETDLVNEPAPVQPAPVQPVQPFIVNIPDTFVLRRESRIVEMWATWVNRPRYGRNPRTWWIIAAIMVALTALGIALAALLSNPGTASHPAIRPAATASAKAGKTTHPKKRVVAVQPAPPQSFLNPARDSATGTSSLTGTVVYNGKTEVIDADYNPTAFANVSGPFAHNGNWDGAFPTRTVFFGNGYALHVLWTSEGRPYAQFTLNGKVDSNI